MSKLTIQLIDATKADPKKELRLWDDNPRGFGIRIKSSGVKTFFVQYRSPETFKKARHTIGQYGRLTLDAARREAKKILGDVEKDIDPAAEEKRAKAAAAGAISISQLCDDYMKDARAGKVLYRGKPKKESTLDTDDGRIKRHIKPLLGENRACDVTADDVTAFMHDVRLGKTAIVEKTGWRGKARVTGGSGTARRTVGLLGSIFSYAVKRGVRPDNPCRDIEREVDKKLDRSLSPEDYKALGSALVTLEDKGSNPVAIRAIRALALTGCRRGEIYGLEKPEVDAHNRCLRFDDTKTGQKVRAIGSAALDLIILAPFDEESDYLFPAAQGDGHITDVKVFKEACRLAGLDGVTLHTLRHGFASVAHELEYSELTIAALLGHRLHSITSRYTHNIDKAIVAAADRVSNTIAARLEGQEDTGAKVVDMASRPVAS